MIMQSLKTVFLFVSLIIGFTMCKAQNHIDPNQAQTDLQTIEVNGEELHYVMEGTGDPLIFIHGGIGDFSAWIPRLKTFSKDFKVITYSRRYAYPNKQVFDSLADYSQVIHAKDLKALIQKLNLTKVNLVGHSYGALTALATAIENPEIINSLVLGEPPAVSVLTENKKGSDSWQEFIENYISPSAQAFRQNNNEEGVERFLQGVMGNDFRISQVPTDVKQSWMNNVLEIWGQNINQSSEPLDENKIKSLNAPVLLLYGDSSPKFFGEIIKELDRLLPNSEMVLIENSSHGLYFENPQACDQAVMDFLAKN